MRQSSLVKPKTYNDIYFTVFFSLIWTRRILVTYFRVFIMKVPIIWVHADTIISVFLVGFFCLSLAVFFQRVYVKDVLLFLTVCALYFLNYAIYKNNRTYFWQNSREIIYHIFPMFFLGVCLYHDDNQRLLEAIHRVSLVSVIGFCVYTLMFRVIDEETLRSGDMHSAYLLLPHVCLTYSTVLRRPNARNIIVFSMGVLMLLFLGTRGALLCLCVCVIITTLLLGRMEKPIYFLIFGVLVLLILFNFGLLDWLYSLGENLNLSLRILEKIEQDALTYSSGRDSITTVLWEEFMERPILGKGIFADRTAIDGQYAHNVFVEWLLHFGICGAIPLVAIVGRLLYRGFRILQLEKREQDISLFVALFCCAVLKLMLSSSYLMEGNFYLLIGYCCAICRGKPSVFRLHAEANGFVRRSKLRR